MKAIVIACCYSNTLQNCSALVKCHWLGAAEVMLRAMLCLLLHYLQPVARAVISQTNSLFCHLSSYKKPLVINHGFYFFLMRLILNARVTEWNCSCMVQFGHRSKFMAILYGASFPKSSWGSRCHRHGRGSCLGKRADGDSPCPGLCL